MSDPTIQVNAETEITNPTLANIKFLHMDYSTDGGTTWSSYKVKPETLFALLLPTGSIIMWKGTVATIPTGWVLCDGNNSTPDLRDKFVIGAKQDSGGVAKTNVTGSLTQTGGAATHTHTINDSGHFHGISGTSLTPSNSFPGGTFPDLEGSSVDIITGSTDAATTGVTAATASSLAPYYALAFIMKS